MTPSERAEKIIDYVETHLPHDANVTKEWVTAQIREAEKEAVKLGWDDCVKSFYEPQIEELEASGFKKGRASMREEAAKVAEGHAEQCEGIICADCSEAISERIRAIVG